MKLRIIAFVTLGLCHKDIYTNIITELQKEKENKILEKTDEFEYYNNLASDENFHLLPIRASLVVYCY